MARQSTHPQAVASLDPVWDRIREEADEAAKKDPSLGGFIFGAMLNQPRFEEALIAPACPAHGQCDSPPN